MSDEKKYHTDRVRQELDLGYRSESRHAANAHLRLAALHMSKLEMSQSPENGPPSDGPRMTIHAPIQENS
jgi:hypothetical protein